MTRAFAPLSYPPHTRLPYWQPPVRTTPCPRCGLRLVRVLDAAVRACLFCRKEVKRGLD